MNMLDIRRYEMLVRVKEFGVAHADLFPATALGGSLFAAVGAAIDNVTSHGTTQAHRAAAGHATSAKAAARDRLRESLLKISRTARAVAVGTPELDGKFRVPRSRSDQRLVLAARAFVQEATPLRDLFVTHHLPATFLDDLAADITAFERVIQEHAEVKESRAAARAGISDALASGFAAVERLDAIVANALEHQHDMLAEWNCARHVSRISVPYPSRQQPPAPDAPKVAA
jgi:hypothetical protein